jgi:hypothetical protein
MKALARSKTLDRFQTKKNTILPQEMGGSEGG